MMPNISAILNRPAANLITGALIVSGIVLGTGYYAHNMQGGEQSTISQNAAKSNSRKTNESKDHSQGFVVVELFTSEGCSSCPPADNLLSEWNAKAKKLPYPVHVLSYHVDYWDYLGWKDKYSQKSYTNLQKEYAKRLKLRSLYTPQIVVNGLAEGVGSQSGVWKNLLSQAQKAKRSIDVQIGEIQLQNHPQYFALTHLPVDFTKAKNAWHNGNYSLVANLVLKSASTKVLKGENAGRELKHTNVVLSRVSFTGNKLKLTKPDLLKSSQIKPDEMFVLVYLADKEGVIVDVKKVAIKN